MANSVISNELVSIAMAVYNGERFLVAQLESLLSQTWKPIEIVIVDDCSTDNSVAIIRQYELTNPNIRLLLHEKNSGVTKTFETAVRACKGEFIALCDQDDIWHAEKISLLMGAIGKEDAICSNSMLIDGDGKALNRKFSDAMKMDSYYSGIPFLGSNCFPGHAMMIRTSFAKLIVPFPPHIYFDRWISFCAASRYGIKYYDKELVYYRQHESNTVGLGKTRNKRNKPTARQLFNLKQEELSSFTKAPILDKETRRILDQMIAHFHRRWSLSRSLFFFKNMKTVLQLKNKPPYRKVLYCIKMFFKANY